MERKISKTKIEKRMKFKTDNELVATIIKLKKKNPGMAKMLARPKRKWASINLNKINSEEGKNIIVPGKVLSIGKLEKAKKIVAWNASEKAREKIKSAKGEFVFLTDEMKKNPELKGLTLIK